MNVTSSPHQLRPNEVLRADNFLLDEEGALRVRDGINFSDEAPEDTTRVLTLHNLVKVDQTVIPLAIRRDSSNVQYLSNRAGAWSTLGTFATPYDTPTIFSYVNLAIIAAGYEPPRTSDGASFTPITDLPGARWMLEHENSVWAWNTAPTTSLINGPSSLRQSDVENPQSWPPSNQLFIAKDNGQEGMGLGVFTIAEAGIAPDPVLIAFKNFNTYQVNGVFGGGNAPTIVPVKTDMGCVAGRTVQFLTNFGLVRLAHRGFALFNGLNDQVISDKIRPYIFGHDDIIGLNWGLIRLSTATQIQNPPLYICACPTGASTGLDRLFIFDLMRKAWTVVTFPVELATVNLILEPTTLPYVLGGEAGGRRVYRLFENLQRDDGREIAWRVRFAPIGRPMERLFLRGMALQLFPVAPRQILTFRFAIGPVSQRGATIVERRVSTPASNTPGSMVDASVEAEVYCDFGQTGEVLWSEVSGSGYVGIRAASWDMRSYGRVRPLRA